MILILYASFLIVSCFARTIPPLGWNSWQAYEGGISEAIIVREANWFVTNLLPHGWEYVVIDGGWDTDPKTNKIYTDGYSRTIPVPDLWPSSAGGVGLKALVDSLHKKGIKVGLHLMRGINIVSVQNNEPIFGTKYRAQDVALESDKCDWDNQWYGLNPSHPAFQLFYQALVQQMVSWDIDFIKVDCLGFGRDQHVADVIAIALAIKTIAKEHTIIYSLSPGARALPQDVQSVNKATDMYRITDDLWDCWDNNTKSPNCGDGITIVDAFTTFPLWQEYIADGGLNGPSFPDGDMLALSVVNPNRTVDFTESQKKTLVTLWTIFRNPLMIGSQLTQITPETLLLLTNKEVLFINQNSTRNFAALSDPTRMVYIWRAEAVVNKQIQYYVALFNVGSVTPQVIQFTYIQVAVPLRECSIYDVWDMKDLGSFANGYSVTLQPTTTQLLRLSNCS